MWTRCLGTAACFRMLWKSKNPYCGNPGEKVRRGNQSRIQGRSVLQYERLQASKAVTFQACCRGSSELPPSPASLWYTLVHKAAQGWVLQASMAASGCCWASVTFRSDRTAVVVTSWDSLLIQDVAELLHEEGLPHLFSRLFLGGCFP